VKFLWKALIGLFALVGFATVVLVALAWYQRREITDGVVRSALDAYAIEVRGLGVSEISSSKGALSDFDLLWRGQRLKVGKIVLEKRPESKSGLGDLRLEDMEVGLDLSSLFAPTAPATPAPSSPPPPLPDFSSVTVDGTLRAGIPGIAEPLAFALKVRPSSDASRLEGDWSLAGGPVSASGVFEERVKESRGAVSVRSFSVDLATVAPLLRSTFPALEGWEIAGQLSGEAELRHGVAGLEPVRCTVLLKGARLASAEAGLEFDGIEGSLVLDDAVACQSQPGQRLTVRLFKAGDFSLSNLSLTYQLRGLDSLAVEAFQAEMLGGRVSTLPVVLNPAGPSWAATLNLDNIDAEKVMHYFPGAKAQVSARIAGQVPVSYGPKGLRFGRGWLAMQEGQSATLRLDQPGLLTSGMAPEGTAYSLLKSVENGILNLSLKVLRAEIYEVEDGPQRSVQLRIEGAPIDPKIKAPMILDVNVNGPLGPLIDFGMDSRVSFETK